MPEPASVVLDAMGVLYESADDVAELLVPYVREHGSPLTTAGIEETYRRASLGELTSAGFWEATGVAGSADDKDYCARHTLTPGVHEFLRAADAAGVPQQRRVPLVGAAAPALRSHRAAGFTAIHYGRDVTSFDQLTGALAR